MATINVTQPAFDFLVITNEYGRKLPDLLATLLDQPDTVLVEFRSQVLAGYLHECLIFTMSRSGQPDIVRMISKEDVLSRHPKTDDPLFRTENLVEGILKPAINHEWELS